MSAGGGKPPPRATAEEIELSQKLQDEVAQHGLDEDSSVQREYAERLRQLREQRRVYASLSQGFVERQHHMGVPA